MEKGWFREIGLVIDDPTLFTPTENAASLIATGSADVVDAGLVQILPSMNTIPDVRVFTLHYIFEEQDIMGQRQ